MKSILFAAVLCAALIWPARSQAEGQFEHILQFDSQIDVRTDGALEVAETIRVYAAGNQIQHGIYRDFPQLYHSLAGLRTQTGFAVERVLCDGQPEEYHLANRENGTRVYLGSASRLVQPGIHVYQLAYTTDRQLGFFRDHDELYWNVTGNGWNYPMDSVTATVALPAGAKVTSLTAYTGPQGAVGRDFAATNLNDGASFATTRRLPAGEGLTIEVEWPKGIVHPPTMLASVLDTLRDNLGLALGLAGSLLALVYYFIVWQRVGRHPRRGVIIPRYAPPADFSPAAVRYLWRMGYDNKILTATIMNLAVLGVLKIIERKDGVFQKRAYTLQPLPGGLAGISAAEDIVRRELVGGGFPLALRQENYDRLQDAQKKQREFLAGNFQGTLFNHHLAYSLLGFLLCLASLAVSLPDRVDPTPVAILMAGFFLGPVFAIAAGRANWIAGFVLAGAVLLAAGVALILFGQPVLWIAWPVVMGILAGTAHFVLKVYTREGRKLVDEIEGFRRYLGVAEKDRLNLENPPERTPQLFETFLPYALALGVEQRWAEQFADVLAAAATGPNQTQYSPAWYSGDSWSHANMAVFAASLGSSLAGAISAASTAPGSSSGGSGGGGGGGGGSSGGGGGGGGGGGW